MFDWWSLIRIAVIAITTFAIGAFIKPFFLALRDLAVMTAISKYLKVSEFGRRAHEMAMKKALYNKHYANNIEVMDSQESSYYRIGGVEKTKEEFEAYRRSSVKIRKEIHDMSVKIDYEVDMIDYCLKHYKSDSYNLARKIIDMCEKNAYQHYGLVYPDGIKKPEE